MHLSSLSSPYGIGTMGKEAREFVDFLEESGQAYWQLLPIGPTGYGDSPYQSYSTFAGNAYFIDLDELVKDGLLKEGELKEIDWESELYRVNYGALYEKRYEVLAKATERFSQAPTQDFDAFCKENDFWLNDYAEFMTRKDNRSGQGSMYWKILQYFFFQQWKNLKAYANERGVSLIGDLPISHFLKQMPAYPNPLRLREALCVKFAVPILLFLAWSDASSFLKLKQALYLPKALLLPWQKGKR